MKEKGPKKSGRRRARPSDLGSIDATGPAAPRRSRRWRVSLVILGGAALISLIAIGLSYTIEPGTVTVLNASDSPLIGLRVDAGPGSLEIARVEAHSSAVGRISSKRFDGPLRLRYGLKDPDRPGSAMSNRVFYKVPAPGLRSLTISLSEPNKSRLFREFRLETSGISNFSLSGIIDDVKNGRFPGRQTLGNSVSRSEGPLIPPDLRANP